MMISIYGALWHVVLSHLLPAVCSTDRRCGLHVSELEGFSQPGDIMMGLMLPLHADKVYQQISFNERPPKVACTVIYYEGYQGLQTLRFALDEINGNPDILPNVTLGFQAYDSCRVLRLDLEGSLRLVTGDDGVIPNYRCLGEVPLAAVIGHATSTHSVLLAHILGLYRYPQISYLATSPVLSDRTKFHSFFRTVPSDVFQSHGLAQLVLHFGWTWVGLLAADNDYGQQGIQMVKQHLVKAGVCVAFSENILPSQPDRNAPHIVKVMKRSTATAVVIYSSAIDMITIMDEMLRQNITNKILVATEAWSTSTLISLGRFSGLLSGSLSAIKECTGEESLENIRNSYNDISNLRSAYSIYSAVYAVANALEDLRKCAKGKGPFSHGECADIWDFKPWHMLHYMKNVRIMLNNGRTLYFDKNGDPPAVYDIVNLQLSPEGAIQYVKVGSYDTAAAFGQVFSINRSDIKWATKDQQVPVSVCSQSCPPGFWKAVKEGEPVCCFQCLPCPQGEISNRTDSIECIKCPWDKWPNHLKTNCLPKAIEYLSYEDELGTTLAGTSIMSSLVPVVILRILIRYKTTPIVKANNYSLSCLLLVSLSFCFLCSLAFIGYPQPEKCLLRQPAFGMIFSLCISCILAKTIMVVGAFLATKPGSYLKKWTSPRMSYLIIAVCCLLQFTLCITWLFVVPPYPEYNTITRPGLISLECNEGSPVAFWSMLGYLGLLASTSFFVAFLSRRLPDSFNEATYITFSMLAFLSVWFSFIPASLSSRGKYTQAMEVFAILASSWALVFCMFVPKCLIVLFRPNMNSRKYLMSKDRGHIG
ncbi:extracellular calcium-sensing receptor-like [Spea bombifrons]|uniref:extracellular calcium-sensing receptor-like n=1 Tax=Spea bombifrons TaxID=233779 RepID=UPI00234A43B6|nr:extracellular calcium-sensing receptor-like [Spea bombifrons]